MSALGLSQRRLRLAITQHAARPPKSVFLPLRLIQRLRYPRPTHHRALRGDTHSVRSS